MSDFAKEVISVNLTDEMRRSYLDYAMSVIIGRALPDARDGLKPVHRRVLYSMHKNGNAWNKKYVKSARIIGDVMGNFHPHGDSAIYDTLVRMAQPFSLRHPLVDGQGNFGSIDGDAPAAHRYTEARMARIAHSLLTDIEKETVDFVPNYDGSQSEPTVLPTRLPHLLVNGSAGIAVGMATNIPPHHLGETLDACLYLLDHPDAELEALMRYLPGPDFPTGAIINGAKGIREAYRTGRGRIYMRAKTHIENDEEHGRQIIVVDELPYQVNKLNLHNKIREVARDKKVEGISAVRDESDKEGIRLVIELKRGEVGEVVLNNLFQNTALQCVFGINMVALVGGQPKLMNLKELLNVFLAHRREVITRRSLFELARARERAHILEGLAVALFNVDAMIVLIKNSESAAEAKTALMAKPWPAQGALTMLQGLGAESRPENLAPELGLHGAHYTLSAEQAQSILELRLNRLTGLEQHKIVQEFENLMGSITALLDILQTPARLLEVLRGELEEIRAQFADPRRTQIIDDHINLSLEDLIAEEDRVITLSHSGYIKAQPLSDYEAQRRGGTGRSVTAVKDEDFVAQLLVANTHDTMLCFSNKGKIYWLKVYELPLGGRNAKGKPIVNLLPAFEEGERLSAIKTVREYRDDHYLFFATRAGIVKKTPLSDYANPRPSGIIAINLRDDDELIGVDLTDGSREIMLFSNAGKAVRFREDLVRSMGRNAGGVRGMALDAGQKVIALCVLAETGDILTVTENGYGKRTPVADYPTKGRGGKGVLSIRCSDRNGAVAQAMQVLPEDEMVLVTDGGTMIRTAVEGISCLGRNTQGVRLIRTRDEEKLIAVARILAEESDD